jgi:small subunit ribosomal protein S6
MKPYEVVVLFHPDLEIDLDTPRKKVESLISDSKGKITKTDIWGKRRLAYPIQHEDFAVYLYYEVELPAENVSKLEGALNITDEVIRYLITHPVPEVEEEDDTEETAETDEKKDETNEETEE